MDSSRALSTCIRTAGIPADQRVAHWEHELRNHLVGLRCSSHADEGLLAQQKCLDLGLLRIGETRSNAHVIERSPELIRHYPRDSIFINVVCQGDASLYQRGHCANVRPGDVLLYDARYPYVMGCAGALHLLHIDLPVEHFQARFPHTELNKPLVRSGAAGAGKLYSATLRRLLDEVMRQGDADVASGAALRDQVSELLASLIVGSGAGAAPSPPSALGASHLLAAQTYIEAHLHEEALSIQAVADEIGVSVRHLSRLFALQETTVADVIMRQRLARAHEQLSDPRYAEQSISATAYRWGFSSHAHFSRAFKAAFDTTPTELRRARPH
jgi:AraC-like DNA-binding protein